MNQNKKRTIIYVSITLAITWLMIAVIPLTGHTYGDGFSLMLISGCMFIPTIGNILTRLITRQGFQEFKLAPHFKGNGKVYLFSYFIFPILIIVGTVFYFLIFRQNFSLQDSTAAKSLQTAGMSMSVWTYLLICIIISPVVNIIATLGEEIGWRGYLLYQLKEEHGTVKAILLTGVIWGIWHAPMIALGHNYGTAYPGYPVLGILVMIIWCTILGIIEGYVTIKSGSVIPAAICHSGVNGLASIGMMFFVGTPLPIVGPIFCGVIPMIPACIFAVLLLLKMKKGNM